MESSAITASDTRKPQHWGRRRAEAKFAGMFLMRSVSFIITAMAAPQHAVAHLLCKISKNWPKLWKGGGKIFVDGSDLAAEHGAYACHKLANGEWFDEIVVGTGVQGIDNDGRRHVDGAGNDAHSRGLTALLNLFDNLHA